MTIRSPPLPPPLHGTDHPNHLNPQPVTSPPLSQPSLPPPFCPLPRLLPLGRGKRAVWKGEEGGGGEKAIGEGEYMRRRRIVKRAGDNDCVRRSPAGGAGGARCGSFCPPAPEQPSSQLAGSTGVPGPSCVRCHGSCVRVNGSWFSGHVSWDMVHGSLVGTARLVFF